MRLVLLLMSLFLASVSSAADWKMQAGSTLGFSTSYQGEVFQGRFGKFTPQIRFDPAKLAQSRFDVVITLGSANTSNDERDEILHGVDFFNSGKWTQARYSATKFRALGGNRYAAYGSLSLRGVSKPVTLTFTWTPGAKPVLVGEALLKRLDFGVGGGDWTDTSTIANEVKVKTRLVLAPKL